MCFVVPVKEDLLKPIAVPHSMYENMIRKIRSK